MTWAHVVRAVHLSRRSRGRQEEAAREAAGSAYRRLALGELDFSPVHGRHCTCMRCEQLTGHQH